MNILYPASPTQPDESKLSPSLAFRKQVGKVIGSIFLFLLVYLLLVLAAAALAIGCCWLGIMIITAIHNFYALIFGFGLVCVGFSVIYFLVKFIFSKSKDENASRVEITEAEQPRLFEFIRRLSKETHTPFPKKIFISPDVNASVFYNSSFWSMFLPVKKNLVIGLGLVNSINASELKAVIAHEFGHFSQRSMKLGSFTYNVNRVIYNMLYDNEGYSDFLATWGRVHRFLALFANITARIANGIRYILRGMYGFINKNYMGLSREMEFHADAVAASVAGGNNLVRSLSRIEIASDCYQSALNNADIWLKENKLSQNIFSNQLVILRAWASDHQLPLKQGLPEVSFSIIQSISKSRINFKNQWASHPTLEERTSHLERLNMDCVPDETSAWALFDDTKRLQEQMTGVLYRSVKPEPGFAILDAAQFEESYTRDKDQYRLPAVYQGFYSHRYIDIKGWDLEALAAAHSSLRFDELFSRENGLLQITINKNLNDLNTARAIKEKNIDVKSFDFDGQKYELTDCDTIIEQLEKEIKADQDRLKELDQQAFGFFCTQAGERSVDIKNAYRRYGSVTSDLDTYLETANAILDLTKPFYEAALLPERIRTEIITLKELEKKLKSAFSELISAGVLLPDFNLELHVQVANFVANDYAYFVSNEFVNTELAELRDLVVKVYDWFSENLFRVYKQMLEEQLEEVK